MTEDKPVVRDALHAMTGLGATALRDAVELALALQPHDRTRPLILIFTDGYDTTSWLTEDAVVDTARRVGVVIHAVRVESDRFLERLAESSGGRTWSATNDRQLRELFTSALDETRPLPPDLHAEGPHARRLARAEGAPPERPRRHHRAPGLFRRGSIAFRIFATTVKFGSTTFAISYSAACPSSVCAPRSVNP